jgi:hypothetical protein
MAKNTPSIVTKQDIWHTLSKVNVNNHTEKVGKFTYLSWTWAIDTLMAHYPNSSWKFLEDLEHSNTKEVRVELTIEGNTYFMWLAVMNYQNKAVPNPVATDVANARMRCLTKAIAVAGLGFYIYQGEDVPKNSEENKKTTGVQSTSTVLLQESKDTDSQSPQLDILKTIIPFGKEKGKTYGEVITTPEELTKSIKYWESHWKTQKAKEDALLHLGNLKRLRDSQIVQGVA